MPPLDWPRHRKLFRQRPRLRRLLPVLALVVIGLLVMAATRVGTD